MVYQMFISTTLGQPNKTVVVICFIELGTIIFTAFTSCCGVMILALFFGELQQPLQQK